MNELPRCPKCDCQLPADAPEGLCPKCLVKAGFESQPLPPVEPESTMRSPVPSGFELPSVEELAGRFPQLEILELLGKGGMGAVYKARQRGLDRLVALKILPPEFGDDGSFAERFTREARALARLTHSHIVSIYDFGRNDGLFFILMEFVDGANLRQTMKTGLLTPAEALAIVPQICEALQFAHDEGIVHRDIKPENILIDKRGRVKIADFGLAKLRGTDAGDHSLTATHQVMGTLRYMAPEQMQGSRTVDHRADIYSLGVVFYELLTGELPMGRFAPPSKRVQVDVRLDEIVLRALEQKPEQRYQHASEIKVDVEQVKSRPEVVAGVSAPSPDSPMITAEPHSKKWSRFEIATTAVVAIAIVLAAVNGIFDLAQAKSPLTTLAVFVTGHAVALTAVLLAVFQFRRPSGSRELIPESCTALLAVCAGSLPWTAMAWPIAGWNFRLGLVYVSLYCLLSLFLLIVGSSFPRTRAVVLVLVGLIGFGLVVSFNFGPFRVIGIVIGHGQPLPALPGMFVAAAISLLAVIAGSLQLRNAMAGTVLVGGGNSLAITSRLWNFISPNDRESGGHESVRLQTGDEQARSLATAALPDLQAARLKLVPVLAAFNLLGSILLMLVSAMEEPASFAPSVPKLWQVWATVDAALGFVLAVGLFTASIGLFLWKPWARKLTLGVCIFGLASLVFDAPYLARFALPDFYAEIQQTMIAEGIDPASQPFQSMLIIVSLFGGTLVFGLTCLIGQLVYFTRPRVVAVFESRIVRHG